MNRLQRGLRATFAGMAVNIVLSGTKLAAGIAGRRILRERCLLLKFHHLPTSLILPAFASG